MADGSTRPASERLPSAIGHLPNYWSLLAEADRLAPRGTRFLVAAPLVSGRFRGARPAIGAEVTWREVRADAAPAVPLPVAPPRRVVILADAPHRDDARYLEAAIRAAAQATGRPANVRRASPEDAAALAPDADWIAWLAAADAPPFLLDRLRAGAVLVTQAGRDTLATGGTLVRFAAADAGTLLPRRAPFDGRGAPVWNDGAGVPLLSVERDGRGFAYRLYTRITAELALAPGFAEALTALWVADRPKATGTAARITPAQALPARATTAARHTPPPGAVRLDVALWILAALAFALDRWLAWRRAREPS